MTLSNPTTNTSTINSNYVIIVAGGAGRRMQSAIPKQFLLLGGLPVLMHTITAFQNCESKPQIILVLQSGFHAYWGQLCTEHHFDIPHKLVDGGDTRFHSVKNGLDLIRDEENTVIAVHDAVRPLTSKNIIDESFSYAAEYGNAIAAVKSRDSVRQLQYRHTTSLVRDEIYLIQTPQTFQSAQLNEAYKQSYNSKFTDDASVVEESGVLINLIAGSYQNIKITFPEDIDIAEILLSKKPSA
jgi:2-C-methyl-D-erythritol 4-phosphate cytidylyltransferase